MGEEMQGVEGDTGWRKAIPEGRDLLQSRVLVCVVGGWMALEIGAAFRQAYSLGHDHSLAGIVAISVAFAGLVLSLRAATAAGALFGAIISFLLIRGTASSQHTIVRSGLTPLALLFLLTFLATRAGRVVKARAGLAEKRHGRNAAQVIANLSIASLAVSGLGFVAVVGGGACCGTGYYKAWVWPAMMVMCLAAMVEATADTVSSEIGQAFGGDPVLLVGLCRVAPGTDGAVTLVGSCTGIAAGGVIALSGAWAMHLSAVAVSTAFGAGICGLFFDSLLGATVERRGWLGNDLVNFASTVFAAGVALAGFWVASHFAMH